MLYIIATPIGNLEDITLRALRILREADYILCEDTRVTKKLLEHYKIYPVKFPINRDLPEAKFDRIKNKKLVVYHHHSDARKIQEIIELVKNNQVALVTDAGTPGISDPGNRLIAALVETRQRSLSGGQTSLVSTDIIPIPGPSAVVAALSVSGLPTDKFIFKGFVPHKKGRETFLHEVLSAEETVVFYESCHRIIKCLEQMQTLNNAEYYADLRGKGRDRSRPVQMVVCRELTKKFETIYRGTAVEVLEQIKKEFRNRTPKGEFVVVVG